MYGLRNFFLSVQTCDAQSVRSDLLQHRKLLYESGHVPSKSVLSALLGSSAPEFQMGISLSLTWDLLCKTCVLLVIVGTIL